MICAFYCFQMADQCIEWPLISQSWGRATNSFWGTRLLLRRAYPRSMRNSLSYVYEWTRKKFQFKKIVGLRVFTRLTWINSILFNSRGIEVFLTASRVRICSERISYKPGGRKGQFPILRDFQWKIFYCEVYYIRLLWNDVFQWFEGHNLKIFLGLSSGPLCSLTTLPPLLPLLNISCAWPCSGNIGKFEFTKISWINSVDELCNMASALFSSKI